MNDSVSTISRAIAAASILWLSGCFVSDGDQERRPFAHIGAGNSDFPGKAVDATGWFP